MTTIPIQQRSEYVQTDDVVLTPLRSETTTPSTTATSTSADKTIPIKAKSDEEMDTDEFIEKMSVGIPMLDKPDNTSSNTILESNATTDSNNPSKIESGETFEAQENSKAGYV